MAIKRFDNVDINNLTFGVDSFGEYTTSSVKWFTARPTISEVRNSVAITERYRLYQDLIAMKFNYTPNMETIANNNNAYSVTWRDKEWRITDVIEANDKMSITLMCYHLDPETQV